MIKVRKPWVVFIVAFAGLALLNEWVLWPVAQQNEVASFWYVTIKFVVLPAAAAVLVVAGLVLLLRARTSTRRLMALTGLAFGLLYLAQLYWSPLPWFAH